MRMFGLVLIWAILTVWMMAAVLHKLMPPDAIVETVHYEVRPFVPWLLAAALVAEVWLGIPPWDPLTLPGHIMTVIAYLWTGGDDDGRWRRRRKRLAESVRQVGARLVVAPAAG